MRRGGGGLEGKGGHAVDIPHFFHVRQRPCIRAMGAQYIFKFLEIVLGQRAVLGGEKVDDDETELVEGGGGCSLARFVRRAV